VNASSGKSAVFALCAVGLLVASALCAADSLAVFKFTVDGEAYEAPAIPIGTTGELLIPARAAAEFFDARLGWNEELGACSLDVHGTRVVIFNRKNKALINGYELFIPHAGMLKDEAMFVPLGFLAETVGAKLHRVAGDKVVIETERFKPRRNADPVALTVVVDGREYTPTKYRCLPTCDQLRIAATELAMMFQGEVTWDPDLGAAILVIDNRRLAFFAHRKFGMVDGEPFELSRPPLPSQGNLLIPLDSLCEMLGRPLVQDGTWHFTVSSPM